MPAGRGPPEDPGRRPVPARPGRGPGAHRGTEPARAEHAATARRRSPRPTASSRQAQASLDTAQLNLRDAQLVAPSDGVILTRAVEKGSMVAAGTPGFSLTLTSPVWARAYVDEPHLGRFNSGTRVTLSTDLHPDKPYHGVVGFVSPTRRIHPQDGGDHRSAHRPGLPPAHRGGRCRRPAAPGHAGDRAVGPMSPDSRHRRSRRPASERFPGATRRRPWTSVTHHHAGRDHHRPGGPGRRRQDHLPAHPGRTAQRQRGEIAGAGPGSLAPERPSCASRSATCPRSSASTRT